MKRNHMFWMIIGCLIPLLLIFIAPFFSITGSWPLFLFIVAMFAMHLLIPMHHGRNSTDHHEHE